MAVAATQWGCNCFNQYALKKSYVAVLCLAQALVAIWSGCRPDPSLDISSTTITEPVSFTIPEGWPQPVYTFNNNPLTDAGFALGRKLFYETKFSRDNFVSCASCHQQFAGFSHLDHATSHGVDGLFGTRNAPALSNLAWHPAFFWDGRESSLEHFPINPITNPVEMDETVDHIIEKLQADGSYASMFQSAFGTTDITQERIFKALAQFQSVLISANSRYDKYVKGDANAFFTDQEKRGLSTFRSKCESCHKEPLFTDFSYRNNGLKPTTLNDSGRAQFTKLGEDVFKFKVPSLRNVALSRQYMHDGRFETLALVLNHYASPKYDYPTLDTIFQSGFTLNTDEQADILAFLQTLTDTSYVKDKRFADPKK